MSGSQFSAFLALILPDYAAERAAADHITYDEAERFARAQRAALLPEGQNTPNHRFIAIESTEPTIYVGGIWLSINGDSGEAFLYNITIFPEHRRQGFATAALVKIEEIAHRAGCRTLGLNVFARNEGALALYRRSGFSPMSMYWNKRI